MKRWCAVLFLAVCSPAWARPRLLLLGDSLTVYYFGQKLNSLLRAGYPGYDVETHGYCASQPAWFLPAAELRPEIRHYSAMPTTCGFFDSLPGRQPEKGQTRQTPLIDSLGAAGPGGVAVIELGTNLITYSTTTKSLGYWGMDLVTQLARKAQSLGWRCVWIGPPYVLGAPWKGFAGAESEAMRLARDVKKAARGCEFIDSVPLTKDLPDARFDDGIHYRPPAAEIWAARVYRRFQKIVRSR